MTSSHPIDVEKLLADQLAQASPDLLRGLLSALIHASINASSASLPCWSCSSGGPNRCTRRVTPSLSR